MATLYQKRGSALKQITLCACSGSGGGGSGEGGGDTPVTPDNPDNPVITADPDDPAQVVGICFPATAGGEFALVDGDGQPFTPPEGYFDRHPVYAALRRVTEDGQTMVEHKKFYYKYLTLPTGLPYAGRHARIISPVAREGFSPFPSFMKDGAEIDSWLCGAYQAVDTTPDAADANKQLGSVAGSKPYAASVTALRTLCQNRNEGGVTGFDIINIYQWSELQLLMLIEACSIDMPAVFGPGVAGKLSTDDIASVEEAGAEWRGHVGLWGNVWQMVAGLEVNESAKILLWKNDGSCESFQTNIACATSSDRFIKTFQTYSAASVGIDFNQIFFPDSTASATSTARFPVRFYGCRSKFAGILEVGGSCLQAASLGPFVCMLQTTPVKTATACTRIVKW